MRSCQLQNILCDELLKLSEVNSHGSQIKIEEAKFTREQTIVISSPAINQPVVVNENLLNQNSLQNLYLRIASRRLLVCMSLIHCKK